MKIAVFGATGFIGKHLTQALAERGHEVLIRDVRRNPGFASDLKDCDGVVNLGGAPIFGKRWSTAYKALIHDSRIDSTQAIVRALGAAKKSGGKTQVLVNASAIGYYGSRGDENLDEDATPGSDFLAFVCREWEEAAFEAQRHYGIRTVVTRFGLVLGRDGGALERLLPPFKLGLGGPLGFSGRQWTSWVHVDDVVGVILHALENAQASGPLNVASPQPVRNKEFGHALGEVLHRPAFMPLPGLALYLLVGEAATVLLGSQKVEPRRTLASGYRFRFPELHQALRDLILATPALKKRASV